MRRLRNEPEEGLGEGACTGRAWPDCPAQPSSRPGVGNWVRREAGLEGIETNSLSLEDVRTHKGTVWEGDPIPE